MKTTKYSLYKNDIYKKIVSYKLNDSFDMQKKQDKERIGIIKFYDDKIINSVITKSINKHFKKLLELLASIDESDTDPSEGPIFCLDEVAKFKRELTNKYNKFIKKEKIELNNKKLELIEKEIRDKLIAYRLTCTKTNVDQEEIVEERRHSR